MTVSYAKPAMLAVLIGILALPGCRTSNLIPTATNAPAPGFENMKSGSEEDFMLNVGRRTFFKGGSATIDNTAKVTLDKQAEWLNQNKKWMIKLQGFADDPGNESANIALSAQRARNVMNYLAAKGVDPARMWAKGYGRERIVRKCPEIECKVQNRRVISNLRKEKET